ncbi:OB-fold nucleic acid binding domain-containing protein [Thermococcus thioreducens]|uniref:Replication factor A n=1 Tax=Thermococcus thioreducens TaxID=277988 RepID=A0A0Q2S509_9EURY|nr:OB-fold nucleic acid binding domain-containing protein [Thermococcus thioreducens]ASJ11713.1 replication factor A [Thermococcus thioreducens]KQH82555.1 replication factor A [Thermococcus thioreducens]SEW15138.1 replication factor A1 [Thermococcus thioreducens]
MGVLTKEQIIEMIEGQKGLSRDEIEKKISEIASREGISEHAAALMLAEELGVNLEGKEELLHIADLVPGMTGVNVVVKILRKYPPREYRKRDGSTGQVANVIIYDATGKTRLVLWDGLVTKYYNELNPGDVIKIIDPSVREGRSGIELHANFRTRIILNPEDPRVEEIPPIEDVRSYNYQRRKIGELMGGERFVEVRGTIARLYRVTVYDACPQCRRKVDYDPATNTWICPEHGEVQPVKITIIDFGLDDSTGYIRTTLFGDDAAELVGKDPEEIAEKLRELVESGLTLREAGRKLAEDEYYHLLGREIVVRGSVVDDKFLGLILKAFGWDEVDPKREIARVRAELKEVLKEFM